MTALIAPIVALLTLRALADIHAARMTRTLTAPVVGVVVTDAYYLARSYDAREIRR